MTWLERNVKVVMERVDADAKLAVTHAQKYVTITLVNNVWNDLL